MFFCVAEGHVEDGDLEEATVASEGSIAGDFERLRQVVWRSSERKAMRKADGLIMFNHV